MSLNSSAQSSFPISPQAVPAGPAHVALLPDGNGRWAIARGLQRTEGHRAGVDVVRRVVRSAPDLGIRTLTVHAIASANWRRPPEEVGGILGCIGEFLDSERATCVSREVRVTVIGRRDRLPPDVLRSVEAVERATSDGRRLHLRLAVDYSSRETIRDAVTRTWGLGRDVVDRVLGGDGPPGSPVPEVDLVVRTGGEMRLSDFVLWECAYAELVFVPTLWPDFTEDDFAAAVAEFRRRDRRFGGLPSEAGAPVTAAAGG